MLCPQRITGTNKHCRIKVISKTGALQSYCEVYGFTEVPAPTQKEAQLKLLVPFNYLHFWALPTENSIYGLKILSSSWVPHPCLPGYFPFSNYFFYFLMPLPEGPGRHDVPLQGQQCRAPSPLGHQEEPAARSEYEHGQKRSSRRLFFSLLPFVFVRHTVSSLLFAADTLVPLSGGWLLGVQPLGARLS